MSEEEDEQDFAGLDSIYESLKSIVVHSNIVDKSEADDVARRNNLSEERYEFDRVNKELMALDELVSGTSSALMVEEETVGALCSPSGGTIDFQHDAVLADLEALAERLKAGSVAHHEDTVVRFPMGQSNDAERIDAIRKQTANLKNLFTHGFRKDQIDLASLGN